MEWNEQGGAAFPIPHTVEPGGYECETGMSLRDWLAGNAAASIIGGLAAAQVATDESAADLIAKASYLLADAMLRARTK